jgi:hypothetical protein
MKHYLLIAVLTFGETFLAIQSLADEIPITDALKVKTDIDKIANDLSLGNSSHGELESATLSWDQSSPSAHVSMKLRLHDKQQECMNRPFGGKWCADAYNYWVNINVSANFNNCNLTDIAASSENLIYAVPMTFATLLVNSAAMRMALADQMHVANCN